MFVANFLGTTNVISGTFKNNIFTSNNGLIINDIQDNQNATSILLRPQNLYFENFDTKLQNFTAKVKNQEFLGKKISALEPNFIKPASSP